MLGMAGEEEGVSSSRGGESNVREKQIDGRLRFEIPPTVVVVGFGVETRPPGDAEEVREEERVVK